MSIVLNELVGAEKSLQERALGKKPCETLSRVAKYYIHKEVNRRDVRRLLDDFLLQCDPTASLVSWADTLDGIVKGAYKYPLIVIEAVEITVPEMNKIDALQGRQLRRLAFTLLCIAKYRKLVSDTANYWVNTQDNEIMNMANINTSIKRQSAMFGQLVETGLIRPSKQIDNLNVQVLFAENGETAMRITDFRNLGYQYMRYHGEPYFVCERCGVTTKSNNASTGRKQTYCKECAAKVKVQQSVNSIMRNKTEAQTEKKYTVYMHCFPDEKRYVGITSRTLHERWRDGRGYSTQDKIAIAIDKCGWDQVNHYVVKDVFDLTAAKRAEAALIRKYQADNPAFGYNCYGSRYSKVDEALDPNMTPKIDLCKVDGRGAKIENFVQ